MVAVKEKNIELAKILDVTILPNRGHGPSLLCWEAGVTEASPRSGMSPTGQLPTTHTHWRY
jgi:hypothetical protein